jgi:hypothetical protein
VKRNVFDRAVFSRLYLGKFSFLSNVPLILLNCPQFPPFGDADFRHTNLPLNGGLFFIFHTDTGVVGLMHLTSAMSLKR